MLGTYKTPGVYLEQVFIQPEVSLPTGIPGFIGFADAWVRLRELPSEINIPDALQGKLEYKDKQLIFKGVISKEEQELLIELSNQSSEFRKAVDELIKNAQSVVVINRKEEFADKFNVSSDGYLKESVIGFFDNGGTRCYVVRADNTNNSLENALKEAIKALAPLTDIDLVAIPDVMLLPDNDAIIRVQQEVIGHCTEQGNRLAILDTLPLRLQEGKSPNQVIQVIKEQQLQQIDTNYAALYHPWIKNSQDYSLPENPDVTKKGRFVPPCGHIAGIFARSDRTRGVFKAPANEEIQDAVGLEVLIDNSEQDELNPLGINCLRAFPGRGIRVWGARTLSREPNWRYINVRRLFLTLQRWIDMNMNWVTFEPNSLQLWVGIERELSSYLTQLWRAGALKGETPGQAFYVKCNAETNPPENREVGKVSTEIGLAPTSPAEFIVVRITQRPNTTELNG